MVETNPDKKHDFTQELKIIFEERAIDVRKFVIIVTMGNMFFQIKNFGKLLDNRGDLIMQSCYWVFTLLSSFLTAYSFSPGRLMLVKYGLLILIFRNILRLYNFE